jgi:hypothetical protein
MFAQPVSDLDETTKRLLGVTDQQKNVPYIMLEGVDSRSAGVVIHPEFMFSEQILSYELNFTLLGIPYEDLLLVIDGTRGIDVVPLWELFRFSSIADNYGFSKEVYLHALYTRIAWPLVFVILMLLSALIAWNFRLSSAAFFKLLWVPIPVVVTVIAYAAIEVIRFLLSIVLYTVIGALGTASLAVIIVSFVVLFIACTAFFVSRKS